MGVLDQSHQTLLIITHNNSVALFLYSWQSHSPRIFWVESRLCVKNQSRVSNRRKHWHRFDFKIWLTPIIYGWKLVYFFASESQQTGLLQLRTWSAVVELVLTLPESKSYSIFDQESPATPPTPKIIIQSNNCNMLSHASLSSWIWSDVNKEAQCSLQVRVQHQWLMKGTLTHKSNWPDIICPRPRASPPWRLPEWWVF